MPIRKYFIVLAILIFSGINIYCQTYNINDFGAVPDGKTVNTNAIQLAINKCAEKEGGTVYVPAGIYITGTILLQSNVNLYLETGAELKGSPDLSDYMTYYSPLQVDSLHYGIVYASKAENVSITGQGAINGNEEVFFDWGRPKMIEWSGTQFTRQRDQFRKVLSGIGDGPVVPRERPRQMIIFSMCKNVMIRDIRIMKSPFWALHFADCDGVTVLGTKVWNSLETPNSDGIDITSCSNVIIANCDIRAGDDAIAITGYAYHFELPGFNNLRHESANICIANCNLQSRSSGIRIGFQDQNNIRNINISNVNITNSNRGIGIFLRDEGSIENVTISQVNIETRLHTGDWWGNGEPIHISAVRGKENVKLGSISNIIFRDINCTSENGMIIYGSSESVIQNIKMENVKFLLKNSTINAYAGGNFDLRGCSDMQKSLFSHDIPGLYATYVNDLIIDGFTLKWDRIQFPYFTHGIEVNNFTSLKVTNYFGSGAPGNSKNFPLSVSNGKGFVTDLNQTMISLHDVKH
jgi:polygalacturonase